MAGSATRDVPNRSLPAGELCALLARRGLPAWLLEYFTNGLAQWDSQLLLRHDSITCEDLTSMGIVHPLHQRRLLREIEGILCGTIRVDEGMRKNSVSKKPMPTQANSSPEQETNKVEASPPRVVLNHARRRFLAAEGFDKDRVADLPADVSLLFSKPGSLTHRRVQPEDKPSSIPEFRELPRMRTFSKHKEQTERLCDIDFEASELGWDEWLQGRLHSWGPLAIISRLLSVAKQGDLTTLREMKETVQAHGDALLESLSCTPLPPDRMLSHAPPGTDQPKNVWNWVLWRLNGLEDADFEMAEILRDADAIMASILTNPAKKKEAKVQKRKTHRRLPPGMGRPRSSKNMSTAQGAMAPQQSGESSEAAEDLRTTKSVGIRGAGGLAEAAISEDLTDDLDAPPEKKVEEVPRTPRPDLLEKFQKAAFTVLAHVKAAHGNCVILNTSLLTVISLQGRVKSIAQEIRTAQKRLGQWPGLTGEAHEACRAKLVLLKQASEQLFVRFVEVRKPLEERLRIATLGDQGVVDVADLERKILGMQRELAARVLIGESGWRIAQEAGVSLSQYGFDEAPDPWGGEVHPSPPPWEATFLKAIRRFEPLRKGRDTRRKAHAAISILAKLPTVMTLNTDLPDDDREGSASGTISPH